MILLKLKTVIIGKSKPRHENKTNVKELGLHGYVVFTVKKSVIRYRLR